MINKLGAKYLNILKKYKVPQGIVTHSLGVCKISCFLAEKLKKNGFKIDKEAVIGGALLHDIDKIITREHLLHGSKAKELLGSVNIRKKILDIIRNHPADKIFKKSFFEYPLEIKIVYYADKIFEQKICSIKERVFAWRERMAKSHQKIAEKRMERMLRLMGKLEKELFKKANLETKDIKLFFSKN